MAALWSPIREAKARLDFKHDGKNKVVANVVGGQKDILGLGEVHFDVDEKKPSNLTLGAS